MKLEWKRSLVTGDWTAGSGYGLFTIQRGTKEWYLMHGGSFEKYPTVIGTFSSRKEAQRAAANWVLGLKR